MSKINVKMAGFNAKGKCHGRHFECASVKLNLNKDIPDFLKTSHSTPLVRRGKAAKFYIPILTFYKHKLYYLNSHAWQNFSTNDKLKDSSRDC